MCFKKKFYTYWYSPLKAQIPKMGSAKRKQIVIKFVFCDI